MAFNIGDRVHYCGPYAHVGKADFGTIVSRDIERAGTWWVDWDNGERTDLQDLYIELINTEQSEISASISLSKLSVKQLKDLLSKMDDSTELSFVDLKIHFG